MGWIVAKGTPGDWGSGTPGDWGHSGCDSWDIWVDVHTGEGRPRRHPSWRVVALRSGASARVQTLL